MGRKRHNGRRAEMDTLSQALLHNGKAMMEENHKRKSWSQHDIRSIKPLTPTQSEMFECWYEDLHICAHGSAGTGKTFLALYLAINEVLAKRQSKIIIVRSAVPTREVGFLPGTLDEKMASYEVPYNDILAELFGRSSTYQDMKDAHIIEFMSTSYIRGLTWDNAVILVDEGENMTFHEIDSIMTRVGKNSRMIFTGDLKQTDLDGKKHGQCGMQDALNVFDNMREFATMVFNKNDIVRGDFVKSWIISAEAVAA